MENKNEKEYWETRLPQSYITSMQPGTAEYEKTVIRVRYQKYEYLKRFVRAPRFAGKKLLEIGTGIGTDLLYFKKQGAQVTGIDITESSIQICKKRFAYYNFSGDFQVMDAKNLKFQDNYFDVVYSFGVLHHLKETKQAIQEIKRVLREGGTALIRVNAKGWWYYLRIFLWQGLLKGKMFQMSKQQIINSNTYIKGSSPLVKYYSRRQVRQLFNDFTVICIKRYYLGSKFSFLPYWLREDFLGRLLGNHWMVELKK